MGLPFNLWNNEDIKKVSTRLGRITGVLPHGRQAGHFRYVTIRVACEDPEGMPRFLKLHQGPRSRRVRVILLQWRPWQEGPYPLGPDAWGHENPPVQHLDDHQDLPPPPHTQSMETEETGASHGTSSAASNMLRMMGLGINQARKAKLLKLKGKKIFKSKKKWRQKKVQVQKSAAPKAKELRIVNTMTMRMKKRRSLSQVRKAKLLKSKGKKICKKICKKRRVCKVVVECRTVTQKATLVQEEDEVPKAIAKKGSSVAYRRSLGNFQIFTKGVLIGRLSLQETMMPRMSAALNFCPEGIVLCGFPKKNVQQKSPLNFTWLGVRYEIGAGAERCVTQEIRNEIGIKVMAQQGLLQIEGIKKGPASENTTLLDGPEQENEIHYASEEEELQHPPGFPKPIYAETPVRRSPRLKVKKSYAPEKRTRGERIKINFQNLEGKIEADMAVQIIEESGAKITEEVKVMFKAAVEGQGISVVEETVGRFGEKLTTENDGTIISNED